MRSILRPVCELFPGNLLGSKWCLMAINIGEPVGEFTFLQPDGSSMELRAFLGKPLLLIFLRHLA
jgi:hypothetical protein